MVWNHIHPVTDFISWNQKGNCSKGCLSFSCFRNIVFTSVEPTRLMGEISSPPSPSLLWLQTSLLTFETQMWRRWCLAGLLLGVARPRPSPSIHSCRIWGNLNPTYIFCDFRFFCKPERSPKFAVKSVYHWFGPNPQI